MGADGAGTGRTWRRARGVLAAARTVAGLKAGTPVVARADETPWRIHIRAIEDALARNEPSAAERAWHAAHAAAFASRRWEAFIEVGDAYLQIGKASARRRGAIPKARELYLLALFRARAGGDVEGALRAAQAFAALGDREPAERCLRVARELAARAPDPQVDARLRTVAEVLAGP